MLLSETFQMILKEAQDVTPIHSDVDIDSSVKAIRVGHSGDLVVLLSKDSTPVTLENVGPNDPILQFIRIKKIFKAGTTAKNIIALK
jgi:hypothetical protein